MKETLAGGKVFAFRKATPEELQQRGRDETNRALAESEILQLSKSEHGRAALVALAEILRQDGTWSLDCENQAALCNLVQRAFETPSVRQMVQNAAGPQVR